MTFYRLKKIQFLGNLVSIILQNENGPCPLLAISNILLLRRKISIHPDYVSVDHEYLVELVGSYIMEVNPPPKDEALKGNHAQHISDAMKLLPKLQVGLDVNVQFYGVRQFEYTLENVVFDLLDINLVHGWLVDDQDIITRTVIDKYSYNQLVEKLINMETLQTQIEESAKKRQKEELEQKLIKETEQKLKIQEKNLVVVETENKEQKDKVDEEFVFVDKSETEPPKKEEKQNTLPATLPATVPDEMIKHKVEIHSEPKPAEKVVDPETLIKEREKILAEGIVIRNFLDNTASQLTYNGLVELHQQTKERELCVFFRNNHFSTLFKYNGELYLLVTDFGYLNEPEIVWEKLSQIDGDNMFIPHDFRAYFPKGQTCKKEIPDNVPDIDVPSEILEEHRRAMQQLEQQKQQNNANNRPNQQPQYYAPVEEHNSDIISQPSQQVLKEQQLALQQIQQQRLQEQRYQQERYQQERYQEEKRDDCIIL